jgi:pimeloyl-ACP methyl ester carboxylesterase
MRTKKILAPLLLLLFISLIAHSGNDGSSPGKAHARSRLQDSSSHIRLNALATIPLGGVNQSLLVQGKHESDPVLLFLHGGPGVPIIPFVRDFDANAKLQEHFVVVYWDQRGAGKSYDADIPAASMNIAQFLADTYELVEILRARFQTPKIYLVGHSWGSILGVLTVARHPELFHAYVGIGQAVDLQENEKISYQFALEVARKTNNQRALRQLIAIGPPPYQSYKEMLAERRWVNRFGGGRRAARRNPISPLGIAGNTRPFSALPVVDALDWLPGPYFSLEHLWDELQSVNLFQQAPTLEVPVYFLAGEYDYYAPSLIVQRYCQALNAPKGKTFIWFEHSAHAPPLEEPDKFYDVLVNQVLKNASAEGQPAHQPSLTSMTGCER